MSTIENEIPRLTFPEAWDIQRSVGASLDHDPKCSSVPGHHPLSGPAFLCDCGAIEREWNRRHAAPPAPAAVEECRCLASLESDAGSATCGLCDRPFNTTPPSERPTPIIPQLKPAGLGRNADLTPHERPTPPDVSASIAAAAADHTTEQVDREMTGHPTPITDARYTEIQQVDYSLQVFLMTQHARTLERELAEARAEIERLSVAIQAATGLIAAKGRHNTFIAYNGLRAALAAVKGGQGE